MDHNPLLPVLAQINTIYQDIEDALDDPHMRAVAKLRLIRTHTLRLGLLLADHLPE